ncbi:DUF1883 domain-containing protein [Acinetobacter modestus]|uniref:DUF1883 domain-containing protein n=1 Tax=Acinetobacter modestus TaxID=1776740 RepID=UPI00301A4171
MSDFIHAREYLHTGDVVQLECDTQCNFMIMDDSNFARYKRRDSFNYFGGHFTHFPAQIAAPHTGNWNVVIDLGGGRANIRYNLSVIRA